MTSPSRISAIQFMHNDRKTKHGNCKSSHFLLFPKCEAKELFKFKNNCYSIFYAKLLKQPMVRITIFHASLFHFQNNCTFCTLLCKSICDNEVATDYLFRLIATLQRANKDFHKYTFTSEGIKAYKSFKACIPILIAFNFRLLWDIF